MSIRETINQKPALAIGIIAGIIVVSGGVLAYFFWPAKNASDRPPQGLYYTEDDGQTFFVDAFEKVATNFKGPQGKDAVRAYVVQ